MNIPRTVYVIEDETGSAYAADTIEQAAREAGEMLTEFDTSHTFYLQPYTLN